jgi:hypothetical protein
MGLLDKIKFWKHESPAEFDVGKYPGLEAAPPSTAAQGFSQPAGPGITQMPMLQEAGPEPHPMELGPAPPPPEFGGSIARQTLAPAAFAPQPAMPAQDLGRDMQVLQAKLDTLKALLDNINAKLDRFAPKEEEAVPLSVRRWR